MRTQNVQLQRQSSLLGHPQEGPRTVRVKARGGAALQQLVETPGHVNINRWTNTNDFSDLNEFLRIYGHVGANDVNRRVSERTATIRKIELTAIFRAIRERNRHIKALSQLTPRLIPMILEYWSEDVDGCGMRQSHETQVQNFSVLRWFWRMHGIKVEPIKHYVNDPQLKLKFARTSVATRDKSWAGNGVDVDQKIREARQIDPVVARLLYLAKNFGLRANESLRIRPHEADKGDRLSLTEGTKTGRPRDIVYDEFDAETLRSAIQAVKEDLTPGQHAAWVERDLKAARRRLYYVLERIGITNKDSGVTFHGLRAQWAIEQFEEMTGTKAPVRGGGSIDYKRFAETRRKISRAMGHNRIRVTSAYYGSFFKMRKQAEERFKESWDKLEPLLPELQTILDTNGIANLWLVGRRANGANTLSGEQYEFLIDDSCSVTHAAKVTGEISNFLEDLNRLAAPVQVHVASMRTLAAKTAWAENALPLYDVEAPFFKDMPVKMEPPTAAVPAPATGSAS